MRQNLIVFNFWWRHRVMGMKIKLLVLEKIQQCISKYSYAVLYD
jgi:hypothetical protein